VARLHHQLLFQVGMDAAECDIWLGQLGGADQLPQSTLADSRGRYVQGGPSAQAALNISNYCRVEENPQQKYTVQGRPSARASLRYSMAGCQQQPARNSSSCQQEDSTQHRQITHSCCMVNNFSPQFFYIVETAGVIKLGTLPLLMVLLSCPNTPL